MRVEEAVTIIVEEVADQPPECGVRGRYNAQDGRAEESRKLVGFEREFGDDTKAATTPAFDRPEQIRMRTCVGFAHCAIGSDDFCFQQARRSHAVVLREAPKTAALNETSDPDGGAAATLNVAAGLR